MGESKKDKIKKIREDILKINKKIHSMRIEEMKLDMKKNKLYDKLSYMESSE